MSWLICLWKGPVCDGRDDLCVVGDELETFCGVYVVSGWLRERLCTGMVTGVTGRVQSVPEKQKVYI